MNQDERDKKRKKDTDELYRSIGEFIVNFEHVCHAIQLGIVFILKKSGLRDQKISQIILAGMTADPLRTLFESLVGETQELNDNENKILKNILNRFQELTSQRNDIVHSTWFIGWGNEETVDFTNASGMKYHKNKSGSVTKSFSQKAEDFDNLAHEAVLLLKIFLRLHHCFVGDYKIEKNFVISADDVVSVPEDS